MSIGLAVPLALVAAGVVYVVVRGLLDAYAERHYLRGLGDNEAVQNWRNQVQGARDMADIAWKQALVWRREVVMLNNAQRRLRRRLAKGRLTRVARAGGGTEDTKP